MSTHNEVFISCIHSRNHLQITFDSKEKGIIKRVCIPFDFGSSRRYKDGIDRFHLYDLDSPDGKHNLAILLEQIIEIEILEMTFDPKDYVKWTPNWIVARDWGIYS